MKYPVHQAHPAPIRERKKQKAAAPGGRRPVVQDYCLGPFQPLVGQQPFSAHAAHSQLSPQQLAEPQLHFSQVHLSPQQHAAAVGVCCPITLWAANGVTAVKRAATAARIIFFMVGSFLVI